MGKGTLMIALSNFEVRYTSGQNLLSLPSFGFIGVHCKDEGEHGAPVVFAESPLPPGLKHGDFVKFKFRASGLSAYDIKKEHDPCHKNDLEIILKDIPAIKKKKKPAPKRKPKKKGK